MTSANEPYRTQCHCAGLWMEASTDGDTLHAPSIAKATRQFEPSEKWLKVLADLKEPAHLKCNYGIRGSSGNNLAKC